MTDNEIIIDGINVAGCNWLGFSQTCQYEQGFDGCRSIPNCLYKQLERKEQEHKRLTRDYFKQNEWLQEQAKELKRLQAENEELKKKLKRYKLYQEVEEFIEKYSENKGKPSISYKLFRYQQAFEKIRIIAKGLAQTKIPFCQIEEQIQDIINEVLK